MFFKRNNSIEFTNKIMNKGRVPILINNKHWRQLSLNNTNKTIDGLGKELEKLIEEEKRLHQDLKDYQHRKRILMNKIIHLSNRLNIKGEQIDILDLDNAKSEIAIINDEIDRIYESLEEYPQKIRDVNMDLLKETVKVSYSEIDKAETRMEFVDEEIRVLRERLGQYWDEKEGLEDKIQTLYSLLHSIIGSEGIDKLDEKFLRHKEKDKDLQG